MRYRCITSLCAVNFFHGYAVSRQNLANSMPRCESFRLSAPLRRALLSISRRNVSSDFLRSDATRRIVRVRITRIPLRKLSVIEFRVAQHLRQTIRCVQLPVQKNITRARARALYRRWCPITRRFSDNQQHGINHSVPAVRR